MSVVICISDFLFVVLCVRICMNINYEHVPLSWVKSQHILATRPGSRWQHCWEDGPVRSRVGRVTSIRWTFGPVFFEANDLTKQQSGVLRFSRSLDQGPTNCCVICYPQRSQPTRRTSSSSRNVRRRRWCSVFRRQESVAAYVTELLRLQLRQHFGRDASGQARSVASMTGAYRKSCCWRTTRLLSREPWL